MSLSLVPVCPVSTRHGSSRNRALTSGSWKDAIELVDVSSVSMMFRVIRKPAPTRLWEETSWPRPGGSAPSSSIVRTARESIARGRSCWAGRLSRPQHGPILPGILFQRISRKRCPGNRLGPSLRPTIRSRIWRTGLIPPMHRMTSLFTPFWRNRVPATPLSSSPLIPTVLTAHRHTVPRR